MNAQQSANPLKRDAASASLIGNGGSVVNAKHFKPNPIVMPVAQSIDVAALTGGVNGVASSNDLWLGDVSAAAAACTDPADFAKNLRLKQAPSGSKRTLVRITVDAILEEMVKFIKEDSDLELNEESNDENAKHVLDVEELFTNEGLKATRVMYQVAAYSYKTLYDRLITNSGDLKFIEWALQFLVEYEADAVAKFKEFVTLTTSSCGDSIRVNIKRPTLSKLSKSFSKKSDLSNLKTNKERIVHWFEQINQVFGNLDETCTKVSCIGPENLKFESKQFKLSKFDSSKVNMMGVQFKLSKRLFVFTKIHDTPAASIITLEGDAKDMIMAAITDQVDGVDLKLSEIVKLCAYKKIQTMMVYQKSKNGFAMSDKRNSGTLSILMDSFVLSPPVSSNYGDQNIIKIYPMRLKNTECSMFDFSAKDSEEDD